MALPSRLATIVRRPPVLASAAAAVGVRLLVLVGQWRGNPAVRAPALDGYYYLHWARRLASGDLLASGPAANADPYLLNPLYAWLITPLVGTSGGPLPVLVLQALLGALTAGLAADAARRHAGTAAAWIAGLAVAFSASLAHLDSHVSVSGLAALLVAGAVWAAAPAEEGERGHGPLALGLWLGIGALARPVGLLALPLVAWLGGRRRPPLLRGAAVVVLVFAAFAGASLGRNLAVSGEPVVFTAANGHNLYLGNNPVARRTSSMLSYDFRFNPGLMHEDSRQRVALATGREPTRSEVSSWYRARALEEFVEHPAASLGHYLDKARWFFSLAEPPSSADLAADRERVPVLWLAFLPTGLLAAAAAAGALLALRDRDLLLGAGGLAFAHWAACTLTFPLSHYRSPAVPALAVLAAAGVARVLEGAGDPRLRRRFLAVSLLLLLAGWIVPQPRVPGFARLTGTAIDLGEAGDWPGAEAAARQALETEPGFPSALEALRDSLVRQGRMAEARDAAAAAVEAQPWNISFRSTLARLDLALGRREEAIAGAEALVRDFPWSAAAHGERGTLRARTGDVEGARADLEQALAGGYLPDRDALERVGLEPPDGR